MSDFRAGEPKMLDFRSGQTVRATVLHMSEEGEALLSIQGVTVRAKLEQPLPAGKTWLMQVMHTEGELLLRPLTALSDGTPPMTISQLLKSLALPDQPHVRLLLEMMQKAGLPLERKTIDVMMQMMAAKPEHVPLKQWLGASMFALEKQLPLTLETVASLRQVMYGPPLGQTLARFADDLQALLQKGAQTGMRDQAGSSSFSELLARIRDLMARIIHFSAQTVRSGSDSHHSLLSASVSSQVSNHHSAVTSTHAPSHLNPSHPPLSDTAVQGSLNSGLNAGSVHGSETLARNGPEAVWNSGSSLPMEKAKDRPAVQAQETARSVHRILSSIAVTAPSFTASSAETGHPSSVLSEQGANPSASFSKTISASSENVKAAHRSPGPTEANQPPAQQENLATIAANWPPSATVSNGTKENPPVLFQLLRALGLDFEQMLLKQPDAWNGSMMQGANLQMADTLKGLLLQLLHADETPPALREGAQTLIQQITGQQLMFIADRTSSMSHITLVIPLIHVNGNETAMVTIQSRRRKNGSLDAHNCRLLFDLNMHVLGHTMIDVNIVDKNVTLKVFNDFPALEQVLESGKIELKEAIEALGYRLMSIRMDPYPKKEFASNEMHSGQEEEDPDSLLVERLANGYKGVDMRI